MFFQRIADPAKIERIKAAIASRRKPNDIKDHLRTITRVIVEGPQDQKFAPVWDTLKASPDFKRHYSGAFFKYSDAAGRIQIISGDEAGEELFRDITSKHSQLLVLARLMQALENKILAEYNRTRRLDPDGAARVTLGLMWPQFQLYIEALVHSMKATLELYAIFAGFIYPPRERGLPGSMDDHIKFFRTEEGRELDQRYSIYISESMGWFAELKTLRDAVAHFGSAMMGIEEVNGQFAIYLYPRRTHLLENRIPYTDIQRWVFSFLKYCEFYRAHFVDRIRQQKVEPN